jgi:hypothetical protein
VPELDELERKLVEVGKVRHFHSTSFAAKPAVPQCITTVSHWIVVGGRW